MLILSPDTEVQRSKNLLARTRRRIRKTWPNEHTASQTPSLPLGASASKIENCKVVGEETVCFEHCHRLIFRSRDNSSCHENICRVVSASSFFQALSMVFPGDAAFLPMQSCCVSPLGTLDDFALSCGSRRCASWSPLLRTSSVFLLVCCLICLLARGPLSFGAHFMLPVVLFHRLERLAPPALSLEH